MLMDNSKKYKNSGYSWHPNRGWKRKFERDMKKLYS
jgi:hypothetical protein